MTVEQMIIACVDKQIEKGIFDEDTRESQIRMRLTGWYKMNQEDAKRWYNDIFN